MDNLYGDERLVDIPAVDSRNACEYRHRYAAAAGMAKGRRVLDAACGSGYGTAMLAAAGAEQVTGVDVSAAAVDWCQGLYSAANLAYRQMDVRELGFPDANFDLVVSFETIEHLDAEGQRRFLAEVRRVLTPDGLFLVSAPDHSAWRMEAGKNIPHHQQELTAPGFSRMLGEVFPQVAIYWQNFCAVSLLTAEQPAAVLPVLRSVNYTGARPAADLVALCSAEPLPDRLESVYLPDSAQMFIRENTGLEEVSLYCDCGDGFCEKDKLRVPLRLLPGGRLAAEFCLRADAAALRLDPGERPCRILQPRCSDAAVSLVPLNGTLMQQAEFLFSAPDPIFLLQGRDGWQAGETLTVEFGYMSLCPVRNTSSSDEGDHVLARRCLALEKKLIEQQDSAAAEQAALMDRCARFEQEGADWHRQFEAIRNSSFYRLSLPFQRVLDLLRNTRKRNQ